MIPQYELAQVRAEAFMARLSYETDQPHGDLRGAQWGASDLSLTHAVAAAWRLSVMKTYTSPAVGDESIIGC